MTPQHSVKATIRRSDEFYVAECLEIAVVTQGRTLDETVENLKEAVSLHLEGEDPADFGLAPDPWILLTFELELAGAQT
jgi:predicted RNase H-like HicB family nuclease